MSTWDIDMYIMYNMSAIIQEGRKVVFPSSQPLPYSSALGRKPNKT
jgi:hypothetical protein